MAVTVFIGLFFWRNERRFRAGKIDLSHTGVPRVPRGRHLLGNTLCLCVSVCVCVDNGIVLVSTLLYSYCSVVHVEHVEL